MDPDALLAEPPPLHVDPATNAPVAWFLDPAVLRHLRAELPKNARTAETGAGVSTVFFAACGYTHTAIAPDPELFERITAYCDTRGIELADVALVAQRSEFWLPRGDLQDLDLFLVDGRHGFPAPFVDWFYGAEVLKVGGLMAVDDTQILTGRILADFLRLDRHWDDGVRVGRTEIFRKLDEGVHHDEWQAQEYVRRGSERGGLRGFMRRLVGPGV
jgi:hypothetical protein